MNQVFTDDIQRNLQPPAPPPAPDKKRGCFMGCLIAIAIFVVLLMVGVLIVGSQVREIVTWAFETAFTPIIEQSDLPEDQRRRLKEDLTRFVGGLQSERITLEQTQRVFEAMQTTRLHDAAMLMSIIADTRESGLTEAERADVVRQAQRAMRGIIEGKINTPDAERLADGLRKLNEPRGPIHSRIGDNELRSRAANMKRAADKAGVPDEPYEPDFAAEVRKVVEATIPDFGTLPTSKPSPAGSAPTTPPGEPAPPKPGK